MEDVVEKLSDDELQGEVDKVKHIDPLTSLKLNLFSFFESRLNAIEQEDDFEKRIKEAILEKIENGELSTSQLMQLYSNVKSQGSKSLEVLLDVFKPSQAGNVSPLVEERKTVDENGSQTSGSVGGFENLDPEERDSLHKLAKFANEAIGQKKDKE